MLNLNIIERTMLSKFCLVDSKLLTQKTEAQSKYLFVFNFRITFAQNCRSVPQNAFYVSFIDLIDALNQQGFCAPKASFGGRMVESRLGSRSCQVSDGTAEA